MINSLKALLSDTYFRVFIVLSGWMLFVHSASAHGITTGDKGFIQESSGILFSAFTYLGAKHMMTGYDHLLFLIGIVFFIYKLKEVRLYVTLFAIGHLITLISGVYFNIPINAYIVDVIIGLSVVYKGLDNIGAFEKMGFYIDTKKAVLIFGLFHGLGLAAKMQEYELSPEGLLPNLLSFSLGVELGQILALAVILIAMGFWRKTRSFNRYAYSTNIILVCAGFILMGYQIVGYIIS